MILFIDILKQEYYFEFKQGNLTETRGFYLQNDKDHDS